MTELSGEIPTADAQQEAAAQLFGDEYLYGRLLEWAMADASAAEQAILKRADADRLREDYRSAMYDAATVETWRKQADAILYAPTATEAEHVANDLHRYAQLSRLSWQLGGKNVFEAKAVADGMHQLCVERSARMRQLAQQPEARELTRAVLAQLRGRDDPWARVAAAEFVVDYATQDFADAHNAIDSLAHSTFAVSRVTGGVVTLRLAGLRRGGGSRRFPARECR